MEAIVIYHANCMDGFGSAWAFHKLAEHKFTDVQYIPCSYGTVPDVDYTGKLVYILDFSFSRDVLLKIKETAQTILVLDHHKTAQEALESWPSEEHPGIVIEFDMKRSGAGMTWDALCKYIVGGEINVEPRPPLINYIEDRDLWKFQLPQSKEINAVIAAEAFDFPDWSALNIDLQTNIHNVVAIGCALLKQHTKHVESICKCARECSISTTIHGLIEPEKVHHGLVANAPPQFASDVGHQLAQQSGTFGATYYTDEKGDTKWSLRSVGDYDVSAIAKEYGGGGHKNAAGFVIPNNSEVGYGIHLWTRRNVGE